MKDSDDGRRRLIVNMDDFYLLLGLPQGAPWSEVKRAYEQLMEALCKRREARRRILRKNPQPSAFVHARRGEPLH